MPQITAKIGKNAIESLTVGMYENVLFIYREYIQNAVDQIDKAISMGILKSKTEEAISIQIEPQSKSIVIEDRATGVKKDDIVTLLIDVATSQKDRRQDRGFRGIGRLGGLAYCKKLTFTTSYKGESTKSIVSWDAGRLINLLRSPDNLEAHELIECIVSVEYSKERQEEHYFIVKLEGVHQEDLLDIKKVKDYLSMVAPVPISGNFIFKPKIEEIYKEFDASIDEYNIEVNSEQLFKPYKTGIYKNDKREDEVIDIEPIVLKNGQKELVAIGWHSIAEKNQSIPPSNLYRGVRLRKGNIQIGDEATLRDLFRDVRFHFYYMGEMHVLNSELTPNARRDYFEDDDSGNLREFEKLASNYFNNTLHRIAYRSSYINTYNKKVESLNRLQEDNNNKHKEGLFIDSQEQAELKESIDNNKKEVVQAKEKIFKGLEKEGPIVKSIIEKKAKKLAKEAHMPKIPSKDASSPPFRTVKLSKLNKKERKMISKVFSIIRNFLPPEESQLLIEEIEKELQK